MVAGGACKEDSAQHAWFFEEVNVPLSSNGRALSLTHLWLERVALRCALKLGLLLLSPVCRYHASVRAEPAHGRKQKHASPYICVSRMGVGQRFNCVVGNCSHIPHTPTVYPRAAFIRERFFPRIERLRLSSNYLRNDSAVALASALRTQESLRLLDLANNLIGDEGARAFAEALKLNTVMESCSLSHNNISEASKVALREVEVARESLTIFV